MAPKRKAYDIPPIFLYGFFICGVIVIIVSVIMIIGFLLGLI